MRSLKMRLTLSAAVAVMFAGVSLWTTGAIVHAALPTIALTNVGIPTYTFRSAHGVAAIDPNGAIANPSLLVSVNFPSGTSPFASPFNFEVWDPSQPFTPLNLNYPTDNPYGFRNGQPFGGGAWLDELHLASVRSSACMGGFAVGTVFTGDGTPGQILKVNPDGTYVDPWVTLGPNSQLIRGGLFQDRFCAFGGDLIVATGGNRGEPSSDVWRITSGGVATLIVHLAQHLEGLTTLPNDAAKYGPLAGRILVVASSTPESGTGDFDADTRIYAIAPNGTFLTIGHAPGNTYVTPELYNLEDIEVIRQNADFYAATENMDLVKAPASSFAGLCGELILANENAPAGTSGLFDFRWDPAANGGAGNVAITPLDWSMNEIPHGTPPEWEQLEFLGGSDCLTPPPASLGDRVWSDTNSNGVQDAGEPGLAGVPVNLFKCSDNSAAGTTTTDANGIYGFSNLTPGVGYYAVFGTLSGYTRSSPLAQGADPTFNNNNDSNADANGKTGCITLDPGQNNLTIDAGLVPPPASLGDRVWSDTNGNGVQDAGEPGLSGVAVNLFKCVGDVPVGTTTTNASGLYGFSNLTPGVGYYAVFGTLSGYTRSSPLAQGADPTFTNNNDSNADANGKTGCVTLSPSQNNPTIDAGLVPPPTQPCLGATFNFTGGNSVTSGTAGNIRTFNASGVNVHVSAFGETKPSSGPHVFAPAYLGQYSLGLGVTDSSENGSNNTHVVDNSTQNNYVLFEFSQAVTIDKAYLDYVVGDSDVSVWVGTVANVYTNHLNLNAAVLSSLGFSEVNIGGSSARWADLNAGSVLGNVLVIAAKTDDTGDGFKISKVLIGCPPPPCTVTIGDYVWYDTNGNGKQDATEAGAPGVTVKLLDAADNVIKTTQTNASGKYSFTVGCGTYKVKVVVPSNYVLSAAQAAGSTTANDSNPNPSTVTLTTNGSSNMTIDFGLKTTGYCTHFSKPPKSPCWDDGTWLSYDWSCWYNFKTNSWSH